MSLVMMLLALAAPEKTAAEESPAELGEPGKPATNPGGWVTNGDYPARAMRGEREGTTGFRLVYDATGHPRKCDIISSSGHADLDIATCDLVMARALFQPGKDSGGKLVGGTYSNRVRWAIPEMGAELPGGLPFTSPGTLAVDFIVDAQGVVAECKGRFEGFLPSGSQTDDPCPAIRNTGPYPPSLDAGGKPLARRYRIKIDVAIDDIASQDGAAK